MAQTLRLLRLGLLLRVGLSFIEAMLSAQQSAAAPWMRLTADIPYILTLLLVMLCEQQGWHSVRVLSILLTTVLCLYAIEEISLTLVIFLSGVDSFFGHFASVVLDRMCHRDDSGLLTGQLSSWAYSSVPIMISIVPPLLGTWLGGQRTVVRWASLSIMVDMVGRICVTATQGSTLPLHAQAIDFLSYAIVVIMVCAFAGSLAERERAEQRQLQAANQLLAEQAHTQQQLAASRERVRMARDLHDTLAHTLAALTVQLQTVEAALENPESTARQQLARASELAEEGLQSARNAITDLRTTQVKDIGLIAALRKRIEVLEPHAGCEIILEANDEFNMLTDEVEEALFRIAQEALNNVVRHAHATRAVVSVMKNAPLPAARTDSASQHSQRDAGAPHTLTLQVADDGEGFDVIRRDDAHFGLRGIREQAELIGAHMQVNSIQGHGTMVQVVLELPDESVETRYNDGKDTRAGRG